MSMKISLPKRFQFSQPYYLPILSGILVGTSYIPFPPWALFFCLVPLFLFWMNPRRTLKEIFLGGWVTQLVLNLIGFHWIANTAIEFGHFPTWAGLLTLLGFSVIAHLQIPISGTISFWIFKKHFSAPGELAWTSSKMKFLLALHGLILTLVWHLYPMIFPWNFGYPWLWAGFTGAQTADLIGFEGLHFITILINCLIAFATYHFFARVRNQGHKKIRLFSAAQKGFHSSVAGPFILAVTLFLAINFLGMDRKSVWETGDGQLQALVIQGNIGNFEKFQAEQGQAFREPIIQKYIELTSTGMSEYPNSELILWPETAYPDHLDPLFLGRTYAQSVLQMVRKFKTPLLTGSYSFDFPSKSVFNALFSINAEGTIIQPPYRKSILLVFGESFPLSEYIPYVQYLLPQLGNFGRGRGPQVMSVSTSGGEIRFGPQICYEGLYPWFSAGLSSQGAQVFVNITNDSWFGKTFEPYQHLTMTAGRAIEFRRPIIRSTNTGITAAIQATGKITPVLQLGTEGAAEVKVNYKQTPSHTIYEKIVSWWGWFLAITLVLLLGFGRGKFKINRLESDS